MVYDPATNEQIVETYAKVFEEVNDFLLEVTAESLLEGKKYDGTVQEWLQFKQSAFAALADKAAKQADKISDNIKPSITAAVELAYSIGEQTAAAELLSVGLPADVGAGFQGISEYAIESLIENSVLRFQNRANKLNVVRATQDIYAEVTEEVAALVTSGVATLEEAVEIANNTEYGLSAGVWTEKGSKILWTADRLDAGVVWANTFNKFDPSSPFGGYKESGFGREGGRHGLLSYLKASS